MWLSQLVEPFSHSRLYSKGKLWQVFLLHTLSVTMKQTNLVFYLSSQVQTITGQISRQWNHLSHWSLFHTSLLRKNAYGSSMFGLFTHHLHFRLGCLTTILGLFLIMSLEDAWVFGNPAMLVFNIVIRKRTSPDRKCYSPLIGETRRQVERI